MGRELCKLFEKFKIVDFVELGLGADWLVTGLVDSRRKGVRDRFGQRRGREKQKVADLRKLDWKLKGTRDWTEQQVQE